MNKRILILGIVGLGLLIGALILFLAPSKQTGTLELTYNTADTDSVTVKFNGQTSKAKGPNYTLSAGNYTLLVSRPGFKDFSTAFSITDKSTTMIAVKLQLASDSTITDISQILPNDDGSSQLGDIKYFYDKTWAVVTVPSTETDTALLAARYNAATKEWEIKLGPGTSFGPTELIPLPSAVQQAINDTPYAIQVGNGN